MLSWLKSRYSVAHPNLFTDTSTLQVIRLEIGALAVRTPAELVNIVPYAAEQYPQLFKQKGASVLTVALERTFWEKATIFHHESNRPEHLSVPQRYFRHCYDFYCMMKFHPRAWVVLSGSCSGYLKAVSSVIPSGCAAGGILCHAEYALWGDFIF